MKSVGALNLSIQDESRASTSTDSKSTFQKNGTKVQREVGTGKKSGESMIQPGSSDSRPNSPKAGAKPRVRGPSGSAEERLLNFAKEEHELKMIQLQKEHDAKMEIMRIKRNAALLKLEIAEKKNADLSKCEPHNYSLQRL